LLKLVVQGHGIVSVGGGRIVPHRPAGHPLQAALHPPAVQHRELGHAVEGRLHAAGAGSLQRPQGGVDPDIGAGHHEQCQRHIVIGQEGHGDHSSQVPHVDVQRFDELLARLISRVGLAAHDDLEGTLPGEGLEAREIGKQQIRPLVGGHAPRKAEDGLVRIQRHPGQFPHLVDQRQFGFQVGGPELLARNTIGAGEQFRLMAPARHKLVVHFCDRRAGPGGGMHPVRHRVHRITREHQPGNLGVALGHPVDVLGQVQGQARHVELVLAGQQLHRAGVQQITVDTPHQFVVEFVVACFHRRMGGEGAQLPHTRQVVGALAGPQAFAGIGKALQQGQGEEGRVTLVHVIAHELEAQGLQHGDTPHAQHHLLLHPVGLIAAVQVMGDVAVARVVHRQVGVQQQDGDAAIDQRAQHVKPAPHPHQATFKLQRHGGRQPRRVAGGIPVVGMLDLPTLRVDFLAEITGPGHQGDRHHRQADVCCGTQAVPRQHAQAATVGGDIVLQGDLHGEIGDPQLVGEFFGLVRSFCHRTFHRQAPPQI